MRSLFVDVPACFWRVGLVPPFDTTDIQFSFIITLTIAQKMYMYLLSFCVCLFIYFFNNRRERKNREREAKEKHLLYFRNKQTTQPLKQSA